MHYYLSQLDSTISVRNLFTFTGEKNEACVVQTKSKADTLSKLTALSLLGNVDNINSNIIYSFSFVWMWSNLKCSNHYSRANSLSLVAANIEFHDSTI